MSQRQVPLVKTITEDTSSDQVLTYTALKGNGVSIVFSQISGYTFEQNPAPASAALSRQFIDAKMEFWLQRSSLSPEDLDVKRVEKHFAYVQKQMPTNAQLEVLLQPNPGERIYDRYFLQKPFEIAYSITQFDAQGKPQSRVVHENWTARDGFFLASRIECDEQNYPGLLKEARRLWKDARLVSK